MDKLIGKDVDKLKTALNRAVWEGDCLIWKGYLPQKHGVAIYAIVTIQL